MTNQEKEVEGYLHQWFNDVWNQGRLEAIDELLGADCVVNGVTGADGKTLVGPAEFKIFVQTLRGAFPNVQISIQESIIDGDRGFARCRVLATHTGEGFAGPASGKKIDYTGMCMVRVKGGKFVEAWNNFDTLTMYQQLGLFPAPAAPEAQNYQF